MSVQSMQILWPTDCLPDLSEDTEHGRMREKEKGSIIKGEKTPEIKKEGRVRGMYTRRAKQICLVY